MPTQDSIIRTLNLVSETAFTNRDIINNNTISAIDIDQTDGSYLIVEQNIDGSYSGRITIYPQSTSVEYPNEVVYIQKAGTINYPLDARFDYIRRKVWIADTGNHRVIKVDRNNFSADFVKEGYLYYPYSLAVDYNTGGIFIRGYEDVGRNNNAIYYLNGSGLEICKFILSDTINSSSSSSFDIESSSSSDAMPVLPSNKSMIFDYVRSRLWWVNRSKVYLFDVRNKQVNSYDLSPHQFIDTRTIDVDYNTGNVFIVSQNVHMEWYLVQMNRDNNKFLGDAFVAL